uniref:RING-type E3 ubiquitin transferase n=1 Tax=Leersia perrieri TaxID=77586 RepID=A0A0D9V6U2_9ORYZ
MARTRAARLYDDDARAAPERAQPAVLTLGFTTIDHSPSGSSRRLSLRLVVFTVPQSHYPNRPRPASEQQDKMPNRATHWCYACRRPIRVSGQEMTCPNCNDGFIQEISEIGGMLNTYGIFEPSFDERQDRRFGMVEAMSAVMRQRMSEMGRNRVLDYHDMRGTRQPTRSMLIFGSNAPAHASNSSEETDILLRRGRRIGADRPNFSRFLVGHSLEALFEQMLLHNRQGPPPAPQSAIDSMPVVKINLRHLRDDPHCPVCTDKFEVGTEARQMPCKHLYHADCIIPWLVQHNSCPVCRHPLPSSSPLPPLPSSSHRSGNTHSSSTHSDEAVSHGVAGSDVHPVATTDDSINHERNSSFSFLWPFDSPTPDSSSYIYEGGVGEPTVHDDAGQMTYSEWHYD